MVRREGNDGSVDPEMPSCASPAGVSPVSARVGEPSSRSPEPGESDRRVLSLIWKWLEAGVMEDGREIKLLSGTPQGGVISPLLSNIYLSFLDERWTKQCAQYGALVRYADDFVIVCNTRADLEEATRRVKLIFKRLRLELHPDKTRKVELTDGRQGFDFLGCHLHKRMSGSGTQTRLLSSALAVDDEHEAGEAACEGADSEGSVSLRSARDDREDQSGDPWLGRLLRDRQCIGEIQPGR